MRTQSPSGIQGSFFRAPLSLFDDVIERIQNSAVASSLRFETTSGLVELRYVDNTASIVPVPMQPQWHEDAGMAGIPAAVWSVRQERFVSGTIFDFAASPTGVFISLSSLRFWRLPVPGIGLTVENTSIWEIAETANLNNIRTRATITLRHIRV